MANFTVTQKLNAMVGLLVAAMLSVAGVGLYALHGAQARSTASLQLGRDIGAAVRSAQAAEAAFRGQSQEFSHIVIRSKDVGNYDHHLAALQKYSESVLKHLDEVKVQMIKLGLPTAGAEQASRLQAEAMQQYASRLKKQEAGTPETIPAAAVAVAAVDKPVPVAEKTVEIVAGLEDFGQKETARLAEMAAVEAAAVAAVLVFLIAVGTGLGIWSRMSIRNGVLRWVRAAAAMVQRVAEGDLTARIGVTAQGETQKLLNSLESMTGDLRTLVGEVAASAQAVADTSTQIAQGNQDLSERTEEQASTLEETASSIEELTSTVAQNAKNARQASQLAVDASGVARRGGTVVGQVVTTMTDISESSRKIGDIIGVIDGIAFQTNILALNAAVEAARAGEQGRGFAVVAAEVRNLAQRSAAAAKEIKTLIGDSVGKVETGTKLVDAAGKTMEEIVTSVSKVSDLIAEIAAASQEQSSGIGQVNTAVMQMEQVVQQNASLVEEATAATESMKEQASSLLQLVARFNLGEQRPTFVAAQSAASRRPLPNTAPPAPIKLRANASLPPAFAASLRSRSPAAHRNGEWEEF